MNQPEYIPIDWQEYTRLVTRLPALENEKQKIQARIAEIETAIRHNREMGANVNGGKE